MPRPIANAYEGFRIVATTFAEACHSSDRDGENIHWITGLAYLDLHPNSWVQLMIPDMPSLTVLALYGAPSCPEHLTIEVV